MFGVAPRPQSLRTTLRVSNLAQPGNGYSEKTSFHMPHAAFFLSRYRILAGVFLCVLALPLVQGRLVEVTVSDVGHHQATLVMYINVCPGEKVLNSEIIYISVEIVGFNLDKTRQLHIHPISTPTPSTRFKFSHSLKKTILYEIQYGILCKLFFRLQLFFQPQASSASGPTATRNAEQWH